MYFLAGKACEISSCQLPVSFLLYTLNLKKIMLLVAFQIPVFFSADPESAFFVNAERISIQIANSMRIQANPDPNSDFASTLREEFLRIVSLISYNLSFPY